MDGTTTGTSKTKASHSGNTLALSNPVKKPNSRKDDDQPDMNDIRNVIKLIQTIQRLLAENHLMLNPMMMQRGLVKKGLIPIEASRRFTSLVGSKNKKALQDKSELDVDEHDGEDSDETDENDEVTQSHIRSKSKEPMPKKMNEKVLIY